MRLFLSGSRDLRELGGHDPVEFQIRREAVHEGQDDISVEEQPFAFAGMGDVGELMRGDIELLGEDLPIPGGLVEHIDEVAVLKDVFHLAGGKQVVG